MNCPSCSQGLAQYKYHGLVVDICGDCGGIWFDPTEMEDYIKFLLSDREEIPNARIDLDRKVISPEKIVESRKQCPRCNEQMQKLIYAYDSNIILEKCPICKGLWADGGEIDALAIYTKGNPLLDSLAKSFMDDRRKAETIRDLGKLAKALSGNVGVGWVFMPKFIIPLGTEMRTAIVSPVAFLIILANVLAFLYQSFFVEDLSMFFQEYGLIPFTALTEEGYFSFLSSMFLHVGILHLIGNMLFFWIFSENVEEALGHIPFILFYLLFGISGDILHIAIYPESTRPVIGASGAIAGVMGAYFALYPHTKIRTLIINQVIGVPAYLYLGFWILFQIVFGTIYQAQGVHGGVAWFGHIGGFVSGLILAWLYKSIIKAKNAS